jgi:hypothetical protein
MSRRHPLSSTGAADQIRFSKRMPLTALMTLPASTCRQFHKAMPYFFFLATLRVFFAVFFTADFAFFAFFAFLAMLPS